MNPNNNLLKNKKGFLFTLITFLLLFSILIFAKASLFRNNELKNTLIKSYSITRLGYIEDDVISNVFNDLLNVNLQSITRTGTNTIVFNHSELFIGRNYETLFTNYKNYIENKYSTINNQQIKLDGFNNSFIIQPYQTKFINEGENLYLYFLSPYTDINSITVEGTTDSTFLSACTKPVNDPTGVSVTVSLTDINGGLCSGTRILDPNDDNDLGVGGQFYQKITPTDYVEVKFGIVNGIPGTLAVLTNNVDFNITQLLINYDLNSNPIYLESGTIHIGENKSSKIILAQE